MFNVDCLFTNLIGKVQIFNSYITRIFLIYSAVTVKVEEYWLKDEVLVGVSIRNHMVTLELTETPVAIVKSVS